MTSGCVSQFDLGATQMDLKRGFSDVDSDIDGLVIGFHIIGRVLTHPYKYERSAEADALAAVRVWSTGHARFWLGCGLIREDRPRAKRTRAHHRRPLRRGSGLFLAEARKHKSQTNALPNLWEGHNISAEKEGAEPATTPRGPLSRRLATLASGKEGREESNSKASVSADESQKIGRAHV